MKETMYGTSRLSLELYADDRSESGKVIWDEDGSSQRNRTRLTLIVISAVAVLYTTFLVAGSTSSQRPSNDSTEIALLSLRRPRRQSDSLLYFGDQIIDHSDPDQSDSRWPQRYYEHSSYFGGPGYPIFVVLGGEYPVDEINYPFISQHIGKRYSAYTMAIEHRFYGTSMPLSIANASVSDLHRLLTPEQAIEDAVRLIRFKQRELGCGPRGSREYCPVMAVGASYSGFLSFLLRLDHPDLVDVSYASSTPLFAASQAHDPDAYFEKVTQVAEEASPGCAGAVKEALEGFQHHFLHTEANFRDEATAAGICPDNIPDYITTNEDFQQEVLMAIAVRFSEYDLNYYPPGPYQNLVVGCKVFQDEAASDLDKVSSFLRIGEAGERCFDLMSRLPGEPNENRRATDGMGVGGGPVSRAWEFQSCTLLPQRSMSEATMFPHQHFSPDWLADHCQKRFGSVEKASSALRDKILSNVLSRSSRLLFTNGLNDGWSVYSQTTALEDNDDVKVINFANGAHQSDLSRAGPSPYDTPDIQAAYPIISDQIGKWLKDVRNENMSPPAAASNRH